MRNHEIVEIGKGLFLKGEGGSTRDLYDDFEAHKIAIV
jgi:hypothetical protein